MQLQKVSATLWLHRLLCLVLRSVSSVFINLRSAECVCSYHGLRVCSQTNKSHYSVHTHMAWSQNFANQKFRLTRECRSRLQQDSGFFFRSRIQSKKFGKNRTRSRFSISAVAGVCVRDDTDRKFLPAVRTASAASVRTASASVIHYSVRTAPPSQSLIP